MKWMNNLERKLRRFSIPGLMTYIVGISAFVYFLSYIDPMYIMKISLIPAKVLEGEVWRLFTYIFIPEFTSPVFIIFTLYLYYLIGTSLEHEWGSFKFNMYYLLGMVGTTIAAMIVGSATSTYINLSLFLAAAKLFPNYEIVIFFMLPVKLKYLGWISWAYTIITVLTAPLPLKIVALVSLLNYFVFFGKDILRGSKNNSVAFVKKQQFKSNFSSKASIHRCTVCGITEIDNPKMEFRYCSKCGGHHEYCMEHLRNHEHLEN
jgi:membrane associated rhomboid family serine protease